VCFIVKQRLQKAGATDLRKEVPRDGAE